MHQILDIFPLMDKKKIRLRGGGWFNRVFTEDSALAKLLIDETIFFDGKDVGTDVRIVALGVNEYYSHFFPKPIKKVQMPGARRTDERRRTNTVRWSESSERNEADGLFSAAYSKLSPEEAALSSGLLDTDFN